MKTTIKRMKNKKLRNFEGKLTGEIETLLFSKQSKLLDKVNFDSLVEEKEFDNKFMLKPYIQITPKKRIKFKQRKLRKFLRNKKSFINKRLKIAICEENEDMIKDFFNEDEIGRQLMEKLLDIGLKSLASIWPFAEVLMRSKFMDKVIDYILDIIAAQLDALVEKNMEKYCVLN
jgi:translation elongation factor EF-G